MRRRRAVGAAVAVTVACLVAAGCGGGDDDSSPNAAQTPAAAASGDDEATASSGSGTTVTSPTMAAVKDSGKLRACISPEFRPQIYLNEDNEPTGLDVDLTNALAEQMGVEVEFVQTTFDGLIAGIQADKCDMALSGMTPRGERALAVSFAKPTAVAQEVLLVQADEDRTSIDEFNQSDVRFCVQPGTGSETDTKRYFPKGEAKTVPGAQDCILQVLSDRADVFLTDTITAAGAAAEHKELKAVLPEGVTLPSAPSGAAVRLGDLGFIAYLNTFFGELINNGDYTPICEKHLGAGACDLDLLLQQRGNF